LTVAWPQKKLTKIELNSTVSERYLMHCAIHCAVCERSVHLQPNYTCWRNPIQTGRISLRYGRLFTLAHDARVNGRCNQTHTHTHTHTRCKITFITFSTALRCPATCWTLLSTLSALSARRGHLHIVKDSCTVCYHANEHACFCGCIARYLFFFFFIRNAAFDCASL
jgi:hypothetical protein